MWTGKTDINNSTDYFNGLQIPAENSGINIQHNENNNFNHQIQSKPRIRSNNNSGRRSLTVPNQRERSTSIGTSSRARGKKCVTRGGAKGGARNKSGNRKQKKTNQ